MAKFCPLVGRAPTPPFKTRAIFCFTENCSSPDEEWLATGANTGASGASFLMNNSAFLLPAASQNERGEKTARHNINKFCSSSPVPKPFYGSAALTANGGFQPHQDGALT